MYRAPKTDLIIVAGFDCVFALRTEDGARMWVHDFRTTSFLGDTIGHAAAPPSLVIDEQRVFVGLADRVICLDYATGAILGQVALPGNSPFHRAALFQVGARIFAYASAAIVCLDLEGRHLWTAPHDLGSRGMRGSPTFGVIGQIKEGDGH